VESASHGTPRRAPDGPRRSRKRSRLAQAGAGGRRRAQAGPRQRRSGGAEGRPFSPKTSARSHSTATQKQYWRQSEKTDQTASRSGRRKFPIGCAKDRRGFGFRLRSLEHSGLFDSAGRFIVRGGVGDGVRVSGERNFDARSAARSLKRKQSPLNPGFVPCGYSSRIIDSRTIIEANE
jgi:hypothetical protein